MIITEEQMSVAAMVGDWLKKEVAPVCAEYDVKGEFPQQFYDGMVELGLNLISAPEEFGGLGLSCLEQTLIAEQLGKYEPGLGSAVGVNASATHLMTLFANDAQKKIFFDILVNGGWAGFCLTEPGAGSDAAGLSTTAVEDGGDYVLNGTKCFITNGAIAGAYTVFATVDKTMGLKGITCFLVERDRAGISIGKHEDKMGIRSSATSDVIMEDCEIPASALIGKEGDGFKIVMQTLDKGRVCAGASALGVARAALEHSIRYSQERIQKGKPIWKHQIIQAKLADMGMRLEAARQLVWRAAMAFDANANDTAKLASMCKCFAGDMVVNVTCEALQIHGGYGYSREYPIEKLYRDAKIFQIFEGTNEIQRTIIAKNMVDEQKIAVR